MTNDHHYLKEELYSLVKTNSIIFDFIQESSIDGLWYWDLINPENEWMNAKFWTTLGYNPEDMPHFSSAWQNIIFPEDIKKALDAYYLHYNNPDIPYDEILRYKHKNGSTVWIRCRGLIIRDENNVPFRMIGAHIDITLEKEKSLTYQKQNFRYTNILNSSNIGIWEWNIQTGETVYNDKWAEMIGYKLDEIVPSTKIFWNSIIHPSDLIKSNSLLEKHFNGETEYYECKIRLKHKLGHWVWIRDKGKVFSFDEKQNPYLMYGTHEDITAEINSENELKSTINRLNSILNATHKVAIISTNISGEITSFNKGAENLLGYNSNELILNKDYSIFHVSSEINDRAIFVSEKYGTEIKDYEALVYPVKQNNHDTFEWTYVKKDGTKFPVQITITPIYDDHQLIGYLHIATDITDLKKSENDLKVLLDISKNQNDRLLNFAHIVSHNLRSHAGNFSMILNLLDDEQDEVVKKEFNKMLRVASNHLNETVENLNEVVQFNNSVEDELIKINVLETIKAAKGNLSSSIKELDIKFEINIPENTFVNAVPAYLDSIFLNLISNAIKYRSNDRETIIRISSQIDNGFCLIEFTDNGLGIDLQRHQHKIFGMYKTFHGNADAKGLGLFIVKNQIEAMNGKIDVVSKVNQGSTFKVWLTYL